MSNLEIKAEIKSLKKILCDEDFFYQIPNYQRPYAWDKDNLSDLVDDLVNAYQNSKNENYFCGSLVLVKNTKSERYDIIDGQQRLTSFIILSCVFRDFYISILEQKAVRLVKKAIQDEDDENKRKLTLLTDDNHHNAFDQEVLKRIKLDENKKKTVEKKYPKNRYKQNAHYLKDFIEKKEKDEDIDVNDFVEFIFEKVVLTTIICPSEETAIQIFNVLNSRGMPLSSVDILKSSLMQNISNEKDRHTFKIEWDKIITHLKNNDLSIDNFFNTYLYYTITSNPQKALHKELLGANKQKPLDLIEDLNKFKEAYIDILTAQDKYIYCLIYLRHSIFWRSILTTAKYINYPDMEELKQVLVAYYYQNWIAGGTALRIKQTSFNILKLIKDNKPIADIKESIKKNLKEYNTLDFYEWRDGYIDDYNVYDKRWVKPLLLLLEYFSKDDDNQNFIPLSRKIQIEHILPQNPEDGSWRHFTKKDKENWTNALANLTLLSMRKNPQAGNKSFDKKKEVYTKSDNVATSFEITRQLFEYEEWDIEALTDRNEKLQEKLTEILDLFS